MADEVRTRGARSSDGRPVRSCHDRALGLLAARPRTRRELRDRLLRAGFDADEVEEELGRLEAVGLLDDERYAREFAEQQMAHRLAGTRAVGRALRAKGVSPEAVAEAVEPYAGQDEDRALELARRRAPRLHALESEMAFRRLVSFLSRRGYRPAVAVRAARLALGLLEDEAGDPRSRGR